MSATLTPSFRKSTSAETTSEQHLFGSNWPLGYAAGDASLYRYVGNNPLGATDSFGLAETGIASPFSDKKTEITEKSFFEWWSSEAGPVLNSQLPEAPGSAQKIARVKALMEMTLHQGCIGVVALSLGVTIDQLYGSLSLCYSDLNAARMKAAEVNKNGGCCPPEGNVRIFGDRAPRARIVWLQFSNTRKNGDKEIASYPVSKIDANAFDFSGKTMRQAIESNVFLDPRNPNFDWKILAEDGKSWWGVTDSAGPNNTYIRQITQVGSLAEAIKKGKELKMLENFYCVVCEGRYKPGKK